MIIERIALAELVEHAFEQKVGQPLPVEHLVDGEVPASPVVIGRVEVDDPDVFFASCNSSDPVDFVDTLALRSGVCEEHADPAGDQGGDHRHHEILRGIALAGSDDFDVVHALRKWNADRRLSRIVLDDADRDCEINRWLFQQRLHCRPIFVAPCCSEQLVCVRESDGIAKIVRLGLEGIGSFPGRIEVADGNSERLVRHVFPLVAFR